MGEISLFFIEFYTSAYKDFIDLEFSILHDRPGREIVIEAVFVYPHNNHCLRNESDMWFRVVLYSHHFNHE